MKKVLADLRTTVNRLGKDRTAVAVSKKAILQKLTKLEKEHLHDQKVQQRDLLRMDELLQVVSGLSASGSLPKAKTGPRHDQLDQMAEAINTLGGELKNSSVTLAEKEALLKEVHHRVKNNLQIITSLLQLQSATIKDLEANQKFTESCNRIRTMAMVHDRLYMSNDFSKIDIAEYMRGLIKFLCSSYSISQKKIGLDLSIDIDYGMFAIDDAIPLGLILNELVANSCKYAFTDSKKPKITIVFQETLTKTGDHTFNLEVSDNGCGLPNGMDINQSNSLGLQLVVLLTEQLGGTIKLRKQKGASFRIRFKNKHCLKKG